MGIFQLVAFDLDDTLYPRNAGLMQAVGARILRYVIERLGLSDEQARCQQPAYFHRYGAALRGFIVERRSDIDPEDYLHFVLLSVNNAMERALPAAGGQTP